MLEAKRHMLKSFLEKLTLGFSIAQPPGRLLWMVNRSLHASAVLRLSPQSEGARLVSLQEGQMDAYRVLVVVLCLTVLGVSQEVGAGTLPVEADQVVNISGSLVLAYS